MKRLSYAVILAAILFGLAFPALGCPFPITQEKPKWVKSGLTVNEVPNVKIFMAEFQDAIGETTPADKVYVLSMPDAPNVILVFAVKGCAETSAVIPSGLYKHIALGDPV